MSYKINLWAAALLCAFCLQTEAAASAVQPSVGNTRMYTTPFAGSETSFSQTVVSKQQYFQILSYWNVEEVRFNLDYQVSQTSKDFISSITLSVNGHRFYSFRPVSKEPGKQHLTVTVPKEWLASGSNVLQVEGYIKTTDQELVCTTDVGPDNWLQLYETSGLDVRYAPKELENTIRDFHQRFAGLDLVSANHSMITVPEAAADSELEAAVYTLSGFAKANSLTDREIPLLPYQPGNLKEQELVVLVALYDHLPPEIASLLTKQQDMEGRALLQLVQKDNRPTLVVTSRDPELLKKAGRFAANPVLMGQLSSDIKWVDANTDVSTPPASISRNMILTETGDKLTGAFHQEKTYFVRLPSNRSIAEASKINLDFRYAQNLDFNRSMVTILVNNTPIGSKKLMKELANGDSLTLPIPKNVAVSGNFSVTAAFDLEVPTSWCSPNQDQMPWAYITKDTLLQLNTKDRTDLLFDNYPYPFLRDGVYNHVAVVMPAERDPYTYRTLSNVFNLLGHYADGNTGEVRFYSDQVEAGMIKDRNVIAIGTYRDNAVIRENNEGLYFRFAFDGNGIQSNEKMSIDTEYGRRIGTLQLIPSPYEAGRGFMAITGAAPEQYYLASKLLANEKSRYKLYGDGVIADKDGNVSAHRFKVVAGGGQDSVVQEILQRGDVLGFTVAVALVILLILTSLLLLIRKHIKKRGGAGGSKP